MTAVRTREDRFEIHDASADIRTGVQRQRRALPAEAGGAAAAIMARCRAEGRGGCGPGWPLASARQIRHGGALAATPPVKARPPKAPRRRECAIHERAPRRPGGAATSATFAPRGRVSLTDTTPTLIPEGESWACRPSSAVAKATAGIASSACAGPGAAGNESDSLDTLSNARRPRRRASVPTSGVHAARAGIGAVWPPGDD